MSQAKPLKATLASNDSEERVSDSSVEGNLIENSNMAMASPTLGRGMQPTEASQNRISLPKSPPRASFHRRHPFQRQLSSSSMIGILGLGTGLGLDLGPSSSTSLSALSIGQGHSSISGRSLADLSRAALGATSTRLVPGTVIDKPWLKTKSRLSLAKYIVYLGCVIGLCASALIIYFDYIGVPRLGPTRLVFQDNFEIFNTSVWQHEVEVGGYGNGEFEWTTKSSNNSFVENGILYIVPTLTSDIMPTSDIYNGYTVNLTSTNSCTGSGDIACSISSNSSLGTVINPVQSARLNTKGTASIRYGKVEIVAKMPRGDWIWPALWLLPQDNVYGSWPLSGEIDILETRGNGPTYPAGGRNFVQSTLHWGPTSGLDRFWKTSGSITYSRTDFSNDFHTFGLEWTPDYMLTYVDTRLSGVFSMKTKSKTFWQLGGFPPTIVNGSTVVAVTDPWVTSKQKNAPFDQDFYLILSVAVGGRNGWFPDGVGGKTWFDADPKAMADFYNTTSTWHSSWPTNPKDRALAVKSVKMWQSI